MSFHTLPPRTNTLTSYASALLQGTSFPCARGLSSLRVPSNLRGATLFGTSMLLTQQPRSSQLPCVCAHRPPSPHSPPSPALFTPHVPNRQLQCDRGKSKRAIQSGANKPLLPQHVAALITYLREVYSPPPDIKFPGSLLYTPHHPPPSRH